jgi:hypothetical protein
MPKVADEPVRAALRPSAPASDSGRVELWPLSTCHDGVGLKVRLAMQNLSRTALAATSPIDQRSQCSFETGELACFAVAIFHSSGGEPDEPCGIRDGWWWQPGQTFIETRRFEGFPSTDWKVGVCLTESGQWTGPCERTELHVDSTCSDELIKLEPGQQRELEVTLRGLMPRPRGRFREQYLSVSMLAPVHSMRCDVVGWASDAFTRVLSDQEIAELMR